MKKNFVWWNVKINDYNEKIQATKSEDVLKITKKTKDKFKSLVEWFSTNKLLARSPTILMGWMFVACFLYPGIDTNEVLKNWHIFLVWPFLTLLCLYIVIREENKYKRLYRQVCDWTIIIKKVEIIKFKRYGFVGRKYESGSNGYRVIATDWENQYKSIKYSDYYLWLNLSNRINQFHFDTDELKINGNIYHLWDKVDVYIDFEKKNNYYLYV